MSMMDVSENYFEGKDSFAEQSPTIVLDDVVHFVRRYVVLADRQADAIALWCAHTSAEKRSGKTRALEVLELVVHAPLPAANISDAALFRAISELKPTLLLDEV